MKVATEPCPLAIFDAPLNTLPLVAMSLLNRKNFIGKVLESDGGTFVVRLERLLKFSIPYGDTERPDKLL